MVAYYGPGDAVTSFYTMVGEQARFWGFQISTSSFSLERL